MRIKTLSFLNLNLKFGEIELIRFRVFIFVLSFFSFLISRLYKEVYPKYFDSF
jgi:hypothetical protein